jgi:hypothetical protein
VAAAAPSIKWTVHHRTTEEALTPDNEKEKYFFFFKISKRALGLI